MSSRVVTFILLTTWLHTGWGLAAEVDLQGELGLSLTTNDIAPHSLRADVRYQPDLTVTLPLDSYRSLTAFASAEALYRSDIVSFAQAESEDDLSLYRLWLRYSSGRTELRLGRQKLSFGSATLLRPLMWFDSTDPRDPLQLTEGVDALLLRFYFGNNANIWFWGLYGDRDPRGWELAPTQDQEAEYGGRIQWPLGKGELAASYHHRRADISSLAPPLFPALADYEAPEDRYALDGKWDVTIGLWFEAAVVHQRHELVANRYRQFVCVGADYTFGLGQGLTVLAEHLRVGSTEDLFGAGMDLDYSAFSLRYPWGVVDEFGLILNYDWEAEDLYNFLEWRRTYDRWSFHLMGFANPAEAGIMPQAQGNSLLAGNGVRILIAFNH
jgi:hypothetical protein